MKQNLQNIDLNYDSDLDDEWIGDESNFQDQSTQLPTRNLRHKNLVMNFENVDESRNTSDNEFEQDDSEQDEINIYNVENMDESDSITPPNETIHNTNDVTVDEMRIQTSY